MRDETIDELLNRHEEITRTAAAILQAEDAETETKTVMQESAPARRPRMTQKTFARVNGWRSEIVAELADQETALAQAELALEEAKRANPDLRSECREIADALNADGEVPSILAQFIEQMRRGLNISTTAIISARNQRDGIKSQVERLQVALRHIEKTISNHATDLSDGGGTGGRPFLVLERTPVHNQEGEDAVHG